MADTLNLLPCPFCGNVELHQETNPARPLPGDYIMCDGEKGCGVMLSRVDTQDDDLVGAWNRRASPAAAVPEGALPPLPTSQIYVRVWESMKEPGESLQLASQPYFTGEQMQAYARAAVEADRAQQGEPVAYAMMRNGKVEGVERTKACTEFWVDAEAVPLTFATKAAAPTDTGCIKCPRDLNKICDYCGHKFAAPVPDTGIPTAGEVPVAYAVVSAKGGIHKLAITKGSAERKAARWQEEWPNNRCTVRPLVYGDGRAPASTTPTSGEVAESAPAPLDDDKDPLYDKAAMVVRSMRRASVSLVQRTLLIGYNRASRLMEAMEKGGVVSAPDDNGNREVLAAPHPSEAKAGEDA